MVPIGLAHNVSKILFPVAGSAGGGSWPDVVTMGRTGMNRKRLPNTDLRSVLNQVSHSKIYQTVIGGTGRYEGMEGVTFANAVFTPVGTDAQGRLMISAKWAGSGALSSGH